jgi:hypothetical protein
MYSATQIVGDFFEKKVMGIFELERTDPHALGVAPDLVSRDGSFYVEVKASAYNNGGVINKRQLYGFDEDIEVRRFYAFVYHSIAGHMQRDYPTEKMLRNALDLRSLFLFPFSITKAHFENSKKRKNPKHDDFVQLRESLAQRIFRLDEKAWEHLGLKMSDYNMIRPHEKINIVTRSGHLEQQILDSFYPELV